MLEPSTCAKPIAPFDLLVIDDDQGQLQSLQQLLHISGYTNVELASGGDEAIRKLQNNTPQLILLDLLMPGTNGLDVLAFHNQADLDSEVIVISGETSFPWVKEAMRLGAYDFIRKPYKPEELLTAIEKALDPCQEKRHQRAEAKSNAKPTTESDTLSPEATRWLAHELRVHQIELELQNEELRIKQSELDSSLARYVDLYDLAPVGYWTLSQQGLILDANLAAAKLLGTSRNLLVKQPLSRFILKDDQDIYYLHRKKLFDTHEPQKCELRLVKADRTLNWVHLTSTPGQAADGSPLCRVIISDITERKQAEEALYQKTLELQTKNSLLDSLSKTDPLTGIANRRKSQQVIEQEIARLDRYKKTFCIFLFDIDHFKTVNDTHGHEVGDQVLVELVGLVQSVIRRTDTLGRWGGEEFILVCPETSLRTAQTIAGKICTTVREHEFARGVGITLSIGVSESQSGATLKEILAEVDRKMYLAKQKGRNRVES